MLQWLALGGIGAAGVYAYREFRTLSRRVERSRGPWSARRELPAPTVSRRHYGEYLP